MWVALFTAAAVMALSHGQDFGWDVTMPLDDYVMSEDGYFEWRVINSYRYDNMSVSLYIVNMTSQKWLDETYSNRPIWWHTLGVAIPDEILHPNAGFMWIDGGSNRNPDDLGPDQDDFMNVAMATFARDTGSVASYLLQVPNQPIIFTDDPEQKERSEDDAIAYTWNSYMFDPNFFEVPEVILRFPMAKAGKKGLDCMAEVAKFYRPETNLTRFGITGASKRGWTTWTLTAVDDRVYAQMPMVMSLLNCTQTLHHHYQALGNWTWVFADYYDMGLTKYLDDPRTDSLWDHEDMYRYRSRYEGRPTLLVAATGDEFFMPQDFNYWWSGMPDPKYIHFVPNAEHSLAPWYVKIFETATEFFNAILKGYELPTVTWQVSYDPEDPSVAHLDETITYTGTEFYLENATLWSATTLQNDTRRDYRLVTGIDPYVHPVRWFQDDVVEHHGSGKYKVKVDGLSTACADPFNPEEDNTRWVAFYIQNFFRGPLGYRTMLCTETFFVPNCLPYPDCSGEDCYGGLV